MFVRVETGLKAGFSDPVAKKLHRKIFEIHPSCAEKVRWMRKLNIVWMEFDAPRDKVVHAIQFAFKNPVIDWVFTGDLLPSAAGLSGTLYDLMQDSPHRPGIFHGIEKRKRLLAHDEEGRVILDSIQTILGRKNVQDRVVTGELLMIEGAKLVQSDLEWIARNWFTHENDESWSLLSEDELKHNARFQSEQVGKYLASPQSTGRSRLLQFRASGRRSVIGIDWPQIEERFKEASSSIEVQVPMVQSDEWNFIPDIRFSSHGLNTNTQTITEFELLRNQLQQFSRNGSTRLQTTLAVLPEKNLLWRSESAISHPLRIRDDFEKALSRVAETTDTAIALTKIFEETQEGEPSCFWSSTLSVETLEVEPKVSEPGEIVDLFFLGYLDSQFTRDLIFFETLKAAHILAKKGEAIAFSIPTGGKNMIECFKQSIKFFQYGFEIVADGIQEFLKLFLESPLPLGMIWGVHLEQRDWLIRELKDRNLPFLHFGSTSLTHEARILEGGEPKVSVPMSEFFKMGESLQPSSEHLLFEPLYTDERKSLATKFKNCFSVEGLILKPEEYRLSASAPLVLRPILQNWSGLMVLTDLCGQEFNFQYLEYLLRKCTAMGGQIHSIQVSFVNGLKSWWEHLSKVERDYGIPFTCTETKVLSEINAHWIAIQVISKVADVRSVRTEDFKFVNDRIYWVSGNFEEAGTRWLSSLEGRNQSGLRGAVAIEPSRGSRDGMIETLTYALLKRRLGAEVKIQSHYLSGFFASVSENERFGVEEEWRASGVEFEFIGRVTASPYLVIRNEKDQIQTLSIEDIV